MALGKTVLASTVMVLSLLAAAPAALAAPGHAARANVTAGSPPIGTGTGLRGEYFDNADLTNLRLTRIDTTIDFNWGSGSPDPSIGSSTFSVRWSGELEAQYDEEYTFCTTTDDGLRLWVNNELLVDKWRLQAATQWCGKPIALRAGERYPITLEYFENTGVAMAELRWSSQSTPGGIIPPTQLYPPIERCRVPYC
jgi:hypothetical protein